MLPASSAVFGTDKCNASAATTVSAANVKGAVAGLPVFFAQLYRDE